MKRMVHEKLNVRKAARFAVVINALQIAAMVAVLVYAVSPGRC